MATSDSRTLFPTKHLSGLVLHESPPGSCSQVPTLVAGLLWSGWSTDRCLPILSALLPAHDSARLYIFHGFFPINSFLGQ